MAWRRHAEHNPKSLVLKNQQTSYCVYCCYVSKKAANAMPQVVDAVAAVNRVYLTWT